MDDIDYIAVRRQNHKRASDEQKVFLVNFMSNHLEIANNVGISSDMNPSEWRKYRFNLWRKLATELNFLPGAYKDMRRWKKCWGDIKLNAKQKYRKHRERLEENDPLEIHGKECLTGLDERILQIIASKPPENKLNEIQVTNSSQSYDAQMYVEEQMDKEILQTPLNNLTTENVTVKAETIDLEDSYNDESNSSISAPTIEDPKQDISSTRHDNISNSSKFTHKSMRKRKRSTVYRKIRKDISELKGSLLKDFFQYKKDKIEIERRKLDLEAQKLQFERQKHAFEKNIIAEKHSIESQKVNALLSISNAITVATERGSAMPFAPDDAVGYYYQENEME